MPDDIKKDTKNIFSRLSALNPLNMKSSEEKIEAEMVRLREAHMTRMNAAKLDTAREYFEHMLTYVGIPKDYIAFIEPVVRNYGGYKVLDPTGQKTEEEMKNEFDRRVRDCKIRGVQVYFEKAPKTTIPTFSRSCSSMTIKLSS